MRHEPVRPPARRRAAPGARHAPRPGLHRRTCRNGSLRDAEAGSPATAPRPGLHTRTCGDGSLHDAGRAQARSARLLPRTCRDGALLASRNRHPRRGQCRSPAGAADAIFGADAMATARAQLYAEHGGGSVSKIMLDQAEVRVGGGEETYVWDAEAWFGGDIDKLVVKKI